MRAAARPAGDSAGRNVSDAIDELDVVTMEMIDVHAEKGTVTLEGVVDDAATSRQIWSSASTGPNSAAGES